MSQRIAARRTNTMANNKLAELLRKSGIDIDDDLLTSLQAAAKEDEWLLRKRPATKPRFKLPVTGSGISRSLAKIADFFREQRSFTP